MCLRSLNRYKSLRSDLLQTQVVHKRELQNEETGQEFEEITFLTSGIKMIRKVRRLPAARAKPEPIPLHVYVVGVVFLVLVTAVLGRLSDD